MPARHEPHLWTRGPARLLPGVERRRHREDRCPGRGRLAIVACSLTKAESKAHSNIRLTELGGCIDRMTPPDQQVVAGPLAPVTELKVQVSTRCVRVRKQDASNE